MYFVLLLSTGGKAYEETIGGGERVIALCL